MTQGTVRISGHFGEWLQGRSGPDGPVVLVTVPCPELGVTVTRVPGAGFALHQPDPPLLSELAARNLLCALDLPAVGRFRISAGMPPGGGAGASTAALVGLALAAGAEVGPAQMARASVAAEGASDPLMMQRPGTHLWASRRGCSLEAFAPLPVMTILGGFFGPVARTDPEDMRFPDISDLIAGWREAARSGDIGELTALASESALRTTALRGPEDDPTEALAGELGALGHVRAHTGSARGLVFAPGGVPDGAEERLRAAGFSQVLRFNTGGELV